ncbi:MAG: hypothetical protein KGH71_06260 [Candidatus Micrarchaeota archaeon]|nr:hypothetical protein [Candidatus Micrarchaeota archaeon]MDE1870544.1 hypothetical protein [Candidatus Micrarchaeota archaeon]
MAIKNRHKSKVRRLKKALERTAFASLVADIFISALTVFSLGVDTPYTIDVLFVVNYILTIIVVVALALMGYIAVLTHSHRIARVIELFRFR